MCTQRDDDDLLHEALATVGAARLNSHYASKVLAGRAVILGAGLSGLTTACAVADYFDEVVILETDDLLSGPRPRTGTPQARHSHALLAGGAKALEELSPGISAHFLQKGAVSLKEGLEVLRERPGSLHFPRRDLGVDFTCLSRSLLEAVLRTRVECLQNVKIYDKCRVRALQADSGHHIRAALYDLPHGGQALVTGNLFVDATGHGAATLTLLSGLGLPSPPEAMARVDMGLVTTVYKVPKAPPADWKALITLPSLPDNRTGALILPIEGNLWSVTCYGRFESKPELTLDGIRRCLRGLRTYTAQDVLASELPAGPIWRGAFPQSRRRDFSRLPESFRNLIPIGDTICRFNPQYGQGMSVAALQARLLQHLLANIVAENNDRAYERLSANFLCSADAIVDVPWSLATTTDFADPRTVGTPPPNYEQARIRMAKLTQLAAEDASVHRLLTEVQHMLRSPRSLQVLVA